MLNYYYALRKTSQLTVASGQQAVSWRTDAPAFILVAEGRGTLQLDDAFHYIHYGCLLLLGPGDHAKLRCLDHTSLQAYILQFDVYRLVEQGRDHLLHRRSHDGLPPSGLLTTSCPAPLVELFRILAESGQWRDEPAPSLKDQRLLLEIIERSLEINENMSRQAEKTPIRRAVRHIHEHYGLDLKRARLAELTGYHPHYFTRKFRQETGQSVVDYITTVRINKAKEKLLTTADPVHEIAKRSGYADALYFSRKFKQYTGVNPTEYRQKPKRIAAYQFLGTLLYLGLCPVGGESHMLRYSDQLYDEIQTIPEFEPWDLHTLRSLSPEVIVAPSYLQRDLLRQLEKIAPVLTLSTEDASPLDNLLTLGRWLGHSEAAEVARQRLHALAAGVRERLKHWKGRDGTTAVYEIAAGQVYVMGRYDRSSFAVYELLGLKPPEVIERHLKHSGACIMLKTEELSDYAADHMIVSIYEEEGMELTEQLLSSESWRRLPAVRNHRVCRMSIGQCWYNDGLSMEKQLLLLERLLMGPK